jgi:hypothetical protein
MEGRNKRKNKRRMNKQGGKRTELAHLNLNLGVVEEREKREVALPGVTPAVREQSNAGMPMTKGVLLPCLYVPLALFAQDMRPFVSNICPRTDGENIFYVISPPVIRLASRS